MGERANNMGKMLNNPKQRNMYFLIIGAAALTLGAGFYFATRNPTAAVAPAGANVSSVPNVNSTPGTSTSPNYNKQVEIANQNAANKALKNDQTFVPTLTNKNGMSDQSPIDLIDKQKEEAKRQQEEQAARDAEELKRKQEEERAKLAQVQPPVVVAPVVQPVEQPKVKKPRYTQDDYILISTLIGNTKAKAPSSEYNFAGDKGSMTSNNSSNANANAANIQSAQLGQNTTNSGTQTAIPLAKAGTIFNAILETAVNSDEPSPILAKIVSGPLKGTRLIGSIQTVGEKVVLQFSTANLPNLPASTKISAVAVDPDSSRSALASDVDHHYFQKYGVLLAASFLSGWSQAIARQNTTTTVSDTGSVIVSQGNLSSSDINKQALGSVGTELANSVRQNTQNLKPTITVNSGIAIGILLMDDLIVK